MPPGATAIDDHVRTDTGWEVVDQAPTDDRIVTIGSNFMVGNGYLGYRGTRPEHRASDFVACVVSDTYDMADGVWRELCTVPNALFAEIELDGEPLVFDPTAPAEIELGCHTAEMTARWTARTGSGATALVALRRFASLAELHLLRQQLTVTPTATTPAEASAGDPDGARRVEVAFSAGTDAEVWSLNGDHFERADTTDDATGWTSTCVTGEDHVEIAVVGRTRLVDAVDDASTGPRVQHVDGGRHLHRLVTTVDLAAADGGSATLDSIMVVVSSNDLRHGTPWTTEGSFTDPVHAARTLADRSAAVPYRADLEASADAWAAFWESADVVIDGDPAAQAALRFSTLHNRMATPAHSDRLPIGARGLSCQAYQGAAFWDQEMFNLPSFLFTAPDVARSLLVYRWRTLDGARRKARRLGYRGAYYAWISGDTGDELCPDFFFTDVLTGRRIRNHFNVWQMHVSPDIALTAWRYWEVTGDLDFLADHGAEVLFEVARFLHSFVRLDEVEDRYDVIRLLGPDEWHENVDNDAYTNRLVQLALAAALGAHDVLATSRADALAALSSRIGLTDADFAAWRRVHDRLRLQHPDPETGLIEQFDGFFELDDERPDDLRSRLLHPDEYWGWPNGVAVHTQVSKQPAVVQLFAVDPGVAPLDVQRANYDYYEPRCAHGSSLSHSVHATVATRLGRYDPGYLEQAYDYFMRTATLDLTASHHANVGGTFIGGMHTAANAGAYGTAVYGFGGLDVRGGSLTIDPRLPSRWSALRYRVVFRGQRLSVAVGASTVTVDADADNTDEIQASVAGRSVRLAPGARVEHPLEDR